MLRGARAHSAWRHRQPRRQASARRVVDAYCDADADATPGVVRGARRAAIIAVVVSLVIAAAHERRFRKQLITNIIYPQDRKGQPIYNPAGKYVVKLHANGVERKVVVDDRIPLARDGQPMCSHSTHSEELWVTIIEKAYLKINGG